MFYNRWCSYMAWAEYIQCHKGLLSGHSNLANLLTSRSWWEKTDRGETSQSNTQADIFCLILINAINPDILSGIYLDRVYSSLMNSIKLLYQINMLH